mmetsp:Transcript_14202/g.32873  ORF Transcript_14202/g.32873 Transcript_14202/m.32873 type:complete len:283 (-) Transcript_14202:467-1315(-)
MPTQKRKRQLGNDLPTKKARFEGKREVTTRMMESTNSLTCWDGMVQQSPHHWQHLSKILRHHHIIHPLNPRHEQTTKSTHQQAIGKTFGRRQTRTTNTLEYCYWSSMALSSTAKLYRYPEVTARRDRYAFRLADTSSSWLSTNNDRGASVSKLCCRTVARRTHSCRHRCSRFIIHFRMCCSNLSLFVMRRIGCPACLVLERDGGLFGLVGISLLIPGYITFSLGSRSQITSSWNTNAKECFSVLCFCCASLATQNCNRKTHTHTHTRSSREATFCKQNRHRV